MEQYHKLLERQLRKHLGNTALPEEWNALLSAITETYEDYDKDRELLERAMAISSEEIKVANKMAKEEFEQKMIAQKIAYEKEMILESINDNVSEAVYRTTPEKGLVFVNKAFLALFRFDSEEEACKTPLKMFYDDPDVREQLLIKLTKGTKIKGEEVLFKRKDGSTFWGMMNTVALTDEDGNVYYDGAIIDITQQKFNAEKLQEMNEALVKTNRELDSFVYSIGHDLRAPIASTLGLIELCKKEADIQKILYYNDLKEKSLHKLDHFIKDVLGYSRNARMELELIPLDLEKELNEIIALFHSEINKNITVTININPSGEKIITDKYRFNLVFSNLISNAFRYHSKEKKQQYIHLNAQLGLEKNIFIIEDNGDGIAPAHLDKIFNMFYRANRSSQGSGLGLYIVKEAVSKLNGSISVNSTPGLGTCFTVVLPVFKKE